MRSVIVVVLVSCAAACGQSTDQQPIEPPPEPPAKCNPLVTDDCLTPWPSSVHLVADPTTRTGVRVNVPIEHMPVNAKGIAVRPDRVNAKDGFSPSTPFLVFFADGVDVTQLPGYHDIDASLAPGSAVQIIEYQTGVRVPLFAEVDANAVVEGDRQALIIRPMVRLKPATRYVVALIALRSKAGQPLLPAPFRALRDGLPLNQALAALKDRWEENFAALGRAGIDRASLTLAWDVVTASDETATSHLTAMRDEAFALAGAEKLGYRVTSATDTPADPDRLREIAIDIDVPSYLAADSDTAFMNFGPDGQPKLRAIGTAHILVEIPRCAATAAGPLPLVVFGHGLFGQASDVASRVVLHFANLRCAVLVATTWIGLSGPDLLNIANIVLPDLNNFWLITDRLQQAHVNTLTMTRLMKTTIKNDLALVVNGAPVIDGSELYYFGASNGGIQGGTFMGLTPDIVRGVLNVPGCTWNLMMWRSTDFVQLSTVLDLVYRDALDRQLLIAAAQVEFDYTDPATYAPHLLRDPLPGTPAKRILVQESINDAQVSNMSTRVLARTMGLAALPLVQPVWGLQQVAGPLESAYTQWDIHATPVPPETNTPAPRDNGAHGGIQSIPQLLDQMNGFLRPDGTITHTCAGPCSF
jgi:hypothetical protein